MRPGEIRALRGTLSRAAFARLLGVTPLTVLRWELPEEEKDARRPRPKMVEALKRLAETGVASAGEEPVGPDEPALLSLLGELMTPDWARAEDELVSRLLGGSLGRSGRALAAVGVAQAQLLCRLDPRGALTTLLPYVADAEDGKLPPHVAGRVFVMAAVLFGAPDSRVFNPGRANANAERAEPLLGPDDHDQRVLLCLGRLGAARFLGAQVATRTFEALAPSLARAVSPLARLLAARLGGTEVSDAADRLGFGSLVTEALAERAWHALHGAELPEVVLALTATALERIEGFPLPPAETVLLALGCQCEALCRRGRFAEADAVVRQAMGIARRVLLPPHALAAPAARLYLYQGREPDLDALGRCLAEARSSATSSPAELHVASVQAAARGDLAAAADLADRACVALEGGTGVDYAVHDARVASIEARALQGDTAGARVRVRRFEALVRERPSLWHAALVRRIEGWMLLGEGSAAAAHERLASSLATFGLLGDDVQAALGRLALAIAADAGEAADAELARIGVARPALLAGKPVAAQVWSLAEPAEPDEVPEGLVAAVLRRLEREIAQLARSSATILIRGASGSGKAVVAHALHDQSARAGRPYLAFDCASMPRDLFDGGGESARALAAADGGSLFLAEIGELPLDTQPRLLRFLENGEISPPGADKPVCVDVRVLAATSRDLGLLVRDGRFREDLYHRLNVVALDCSSS